MKPFLIAMAAMLVGGPLFAHHSYTASYESGKTQKIEGTVVHFLFRNPHSFLDVEAPDQKGVMHIWTIEWFAGGLLGRQGVTRDTLQPGDRVIAIGHPGRNPEDHQMRLLSIVRPADGWKWAAPSE